MSGLYLKERFDLLRREIGMPRRVKSFDELLEEMRERAVAEVVTERADLDAQHVASVDLHLGLLTLQMLDK